ncbi:MAG: HAD-IA family hydrolase [Verrucomicrobia bacterium]|nr:HAD-IA family hydrolase [Verrucomicrobiota bacterium]MDA1067521.1 HAD-IA family hydrolase [Verrucomicrobiota bacterium]
MSFNTIHTISFDATGTLFDPFPSIGAIYSEILQEHGVSISEPDLEMRFMVEFHKSRNLPMKSIDETSEKNRWRCVLESILKEDYSEAIFDSLWETMGQGNRWKAKPMLRRTLQALKEAGFRLVVVSNWDNRLYRILSDLNIDGYFDQVFISTELGAEKPSEEVFTRVSRNLAAAPRTLLHIGNSPANDFKPAIRAGWNALLLHNRIPHGLEPGNVLGSIDQLPEVLKSEQTVS